MKKVCLLITAIVLFVSCEQESSKPVKNDFRIKEVQYYFSETDGILMEYMYDNERIIEVRQVHILEGDSSLRGTTEVQYNNDEVTLIKKSYENSEWLMNDKIIIEFKNGQNIKSDQYVYENDEWKLLRTETYSYQGNKLFNLEGTFSNPDCGYQYQGNFEYSNGILTGFSQESLENNEAEWQKQSKTEIFYNNDRISGILIYGEESGSLVLKDSLSYSYHLNLISKIQFYTYDKDTWNESQSREYAYDQNDYLIEINSDDCLIEMRYEKGHGNFESLSLNEISKLEPSPKSLKME